MLIHNDRHNAVKNLMRKHEGVNKQVGEQIKKEGQLMNEDETEETKASEAARSTPADGAKGKDESTKWKRKFIKLRGAGEKQQEKEEMTMDDWEEDEVGPEHFQVIAKLGQGSFGVVYLVEKLNIMDDGTKVNTD